MKTIKIIRGEGCDEQFIELSLDEYHNFFPCERMWIRICPSAVVDGFRIKNAGAYYCEFLIKQFELITQRGYQQFVVDHCYSCLHEEGHQNYNPEILPFREVTFSLLRSSFYPIRGPFPQYGAYLSLLSISFSLHSLPPLLM